MCTVFPDDDMGIVNTKWYMIFFFIDYKLKSDTSSVKHSFEKRFEKKRLVKGVSMKTIELLENNRCFFI